MVKKNVDINTFDWVWLVITRSANFLPKIPVDEPWLPNAFNASQKNRIAYQSISNELE